MSCLFTCTDQGSVVIIERFGKFTRVGYPGLNWVVCCLGFDRSDRKVWQILPRGLSRLQLRLRAMRSRTRTQSTRLIPVCVGELVAGRLNMRIQQLDVSVETKTRDNVFVNLVVSVQYQVLKENVYDAFYKLTDSTSQIRSYVFDVVRSTVPKMNLDDVFVSKEEIALDIKNELTKSMGSFGFAIVQTLVTDIEPAKKVKDAMNEINAATRLRAAAVEKAEAEKVTVVKAAEAEAEAKYLAGQGIARQRQAIVSGLRESVVEFSSSVNDINNQEILSMMLMTQYFDTLKDVGMSARNGTIFLPHQPGTIGDIASQIRDGMLQANAMQR